MADTDIRLIEVGSVTLSPTWDRSSRNCPRRCPLPRQRRCLLPRLRRRRGAPWAQAEAITPPPIDDAENFKKQIDHSVAKDIPPPARMLTSSHVSADEATAERARERRRASRTVPSRQAPARTVTTDWPRDLRSETYMHRLWRKWVKGAAIVLGVFVALNVALVAASLLPVMLTPPALPAVPEAPAHVVPGIALPEAPGDHRARFRCRRPVRRRVR